MTHLLHRLVPAVRKAQEPQLRRRHPRHVLQLVAHLLLLLLLRRPVLPLLALLRRGAGRRLRPRAVLLLRLDGRALVGIHAPVLGRGRRLVRRRRRRRARARRARVHVHALAARLALLALGAALGLRRGAQHRRLHLGGRVLDLGGLLGRVVEQARAGGAVEVEGGHREVLVDGDDGGGAEAEAQAVGEREPVPVLREDGHADDGRHVQIAGLRLQRDGAVAPAGVEDAERDGAAELGHGVLVAVADGALQRAAHAADLGVRLLVLLDEDHGERDERALPHEVGGVLDHGLEQVDGLGQPRAGAGDAERQRGAVAHVRVVRLRQQLDHARHAGGLAEQDKAQAQHRDAPHVVADVADRHVQQAAHRLVAARAAVGERDGQDAAVPQNRVRVVEQQADELVGRFLPRVHDEREPQRQPAHDLLVLRLVRVLDHVLEHLHIAGAEHDEAHGDADGLAVDGRVLP